MPPLLPLSPPRLAVTRPRTTSSNAPSTTTPSPRRTPPALLALSAFTPPCSAHPAPKNRHDRTIVVRLQREPNSDRVTVVVAYRLELDDWTANEDLRAVMDNVTPGQYGEFTRVYAPILAGKLRVTVDGARLPMTCAR